MILIIKQKVIEEILLICAKIQFHNRDKYFMKSQSLRDEHISRPQFLEKFAGKLNVMTKHG